VTPVGKNAKLTRLYGTDIFEYGGLLAVCFQLGDFTTHNLNQVLACRYCFQVGR